MPDWLSRFGSEFWSILLDSGVWLVLGFVLAGVVHALVPMGWIRRQLGGRGILPVAKAAALGLPLPLCSCSVIPVAASLRRAGAGKGASAAFTISTPQTGEESIPLTWALFGPVFAIARPIIAIVTAFAAGVLIDRVAHDRVAHDDDASGTPPLRGGSGVALAVADPAPPCCTRAVVPPKLCCAAPATPIDATCCAHEPPPARRATLGARATEALRHGLVTLPADLAFWLTGGLVLAAVVAAVVPAGWISQHLPAGPLQLAAALVLAVPVYVCATSSTPLAFALVGAGLSPGAALVLLLAGPATNTATMAWVLKDLGMRALVVYVAVIAAVAMAAGLAFDAFFSRFVRLAGEHADHAHGATPIATAGAIALAILLTVAIVRRAAVFFGGPRVVPA